MNIRVGFVSNSSTSSFILIVNRDEVKGNSLKQSAIEDFLESFPDEFKKNLCHDIESVVIDLKDAFHPIISPKRKQKIAKYVHDEKDANDFDTFLRNIGFSTAFSCGNRKRRYEYEKLWKKIAETKKVGFYIVLGSDADEINASHWLGYDLECGFMEYAKNKDSKYILKLLAFRD